MPKRPGRGAQREGATAVETVLQEKRTATQSESSSAQLDFDPIASRDLEQLELADGFLRQVWEALVPVAQRSVVATGCVLEVVSMKSDLLAERRRIESDVGL